MLPTFGVQVGYVLGSMYVDFVRFRLWASQLVDCHGSLSPTCHRDLDSPSVIPTKPYILKN